MRLIGYNILDSLRAIGRALMEVDVEFDVKMGYRMARTDEIT